MAASGSGAEAAGLLAELIDSALQRCHPNHAIVVEARLGLAAWCAPAGGHALLGRADAALAAAERTLPPYDEQRASLLLAIAAACRELGVGELTAENADEAERLFARGARAALDACRQLRFLYGRDAGPAGRAKELAEACMRLGGGQRLPRGGAAA